MKEKERKTRSFLMLIVAVAFIAGAAIVAPFYLSRLGRLPDGSRAWRLITTHDLPNYIPMMEQFDKVLRSGDVYPRWDPEFNLGYGTATANFYPPGTFYITSLINAAINNWTITLFILCALSLAASGLTFYLLSRTFYSRLASAVAALLYMLLPFHQMDLYWRGGIPQFVGYAFMPAVLYFAFKLGSEGRLRYYAALGFLHGAYLMSHIPVSYLFTYVLALYAVIWAFRDRDLGIALRIAGGMAISLLVSAIYWLPAALEGKYAYEWASETFPYHYTYISMMPVTDAFSQHIQEAFNYNALALIAAIVILLALPQGTQLSSEQRAFPSRSQTRVWIVLGILTPFMTTSFSIHISRLIPKIQISTPPFRWLAIACLFTSLLVAASIDLLRKHQGLKPKRQLAYRLLLGAVIMMNLWLTAHGIILGALSNPTYDRPANYVDGGFIPKGSTLPHLLPDTAPVIIVPEGGASEVIQWLPTHRAVAVRVDQPSELRVKTYNFHGWTARIDGKVVPMLSDKDGVQQIEVPPGIHTVQTSFDSTPARTAGTVISGLGLLVILGLSFAGRLRERKVEAGGGDERSAAQGSLNEERAVAHTLSSARTPRISRLKRLAAIVLVIVVGTAIIVMTTRRSNSSNSGRPGNAAAPASSPSDRPGSQGVGSEAQLYLAGRDSVMVAVDEKASEEMVSAISGRNQSALDALIGSGRVLKANSNTRVRVLQTMTGRTKVRILEGPHVMAEGWVLERWLR